MSKDLFDLDILDEYKEDGDILDIKVFDESEDESKYIQTEDLAKETSVSVPQGSGHTEKLIKTEDLAKETSVSVPGGDGESPSAKPYDASSISIPSSTTITTTEHNKMMSALKQSFKEGVQVLELLEKFEVVNKTLDEIQHEFTEAAVDNAIFESYLEGPFFEASDEPNKKQIKAVVKKVQSKVEPKTDYYLIPSNCIKKLFSRGEDLKSKTWQTVGVFYAKDNPSAAVKYYQDMFKEELGEYVLNAGKLTAPLSGLANPHISGSADVLTLVACFGIMFSVIGNNLYKSAFSTLLGTTIIQSLNLAGILKDNDLIKALKKLGTPYLLIVDTKKESKEVTTIEVTEEDKKKLGLDKDPKEMKEYVEFLEAQFNESEEEFDEKKKCTEEECKEEEKKKKEKEKEKEDKKD